MNIPNTMQMNATMRRRSIGASAGAGVAAMS